MVPADRSPLDLDPRFGLRDLLGLRGSAAWLFLLILEAVIALYMMRNFGQSPAWAAAASMVLMLSAGALVTAIPVDPLPIPVALYAAAAPPVATALTVITPEHDLVHDTVWSAFASSYVLAVLVLRGRIRTAWVGVTAVAVVLVGLGLIGGHLRPGTLVGSLVPVGTVTAISVFTAVMRPMQRSLRILREDAMMRAAAEATMAAADSERTRQLARLDRVARPILERLADGAELTATEREECRLLEAELRDGLRAPQLVTDELSGAARGARARGVEVVLLDDGGFAGVPEWVRKRVIDAATKELDAINTGCVTVRVLPLGRHVLATVLATGPDYDRRTEIDTDGQGTVSAD
ncbi:hypothetical protein [Nocardia seriolae]|uniref:Histidine kinase n=1 Tax=Nocardia seriolae TaxID=37332 RepID=A0ABC9YQG3_9NOCA|nr:hypothetical protein [Nocardia seriolae]BEK94463.1 hypothetical protein NSER024013_23690 [Nocardia seriolae]GAM45660.1 hypothetical protein NS07_v2contig00018-0028 [Nocardia seriolae]GAP27684.1 hypothetical protein NSK11_contig00022-0028 [Nocardia seriolae]